MQFLMLLLVLTQTAPPVSLPSVRGDRFEIAVPQGWRTLNDGGFVLLQHSSGASLMIQRIQRAANLAEYAHRQAERVMSPLGFAKISEPRVYKDATQEWVQYEITGNRAGDPHRILYRVLRRNTSFYETIFEASQDRFQPLLTEAESISASIQALAPPPPPRRRTVNRRR